MKSRPRSRFASAEGGATALEFALLVGPLLLVVLGTMEFGRFLWTTNALQQVAIRTARCMGVLLAGCATGNVYSSSSSLSYAQSLATSYGITLPAPSITLSDPTSCAGAPGFAVVTISYTFTSVVPTLLPSLSSAAPVTATACFANQS